MTQTIEFSLVDVLNKLDTKMDKLDGKIDALEDKVDAKIEKLDTKIDDLKKEMEDKFAEMNTSINNCFNTLTLGFLGIFGVLTGDILAILSKVVFFPNL